MKLEPTPSQDKFTDAQQERYLMFIVKDETLGVEINYVKEIVSIQSITHIPGTLEYVMGVMNLRGQIIPVIDMRLKLFRQFEAYTERTCIIVVEVGIHTTGLIVDKVTDVLYIAKSHIVRPLLNVDSSIDCIKGINNTNEQINLLIDIEKLLTQEIFLKTKT